MIRTLLFIYLSLSINLCFSQQEKFKDTKNIYILDVTLSMFGYHGAPHIFEEVRNELIKSINSIQNPKTEIVLVTYQDKILDTWSNYATESGKKEIVKHLQSIKEKDLAVTRTNILAAWKKGKELVDPNKLNIIYLLTDGVQNTISPTKADLYKEVRKWGSFSEANDSYAFLVELVEFARDEKLREAIKETPRAQVISSIDFFVLSVKENNPIISLYEDLIVGIDFIGDRILNIPKDFTFSLKINDEDFELSENLFSLNKRPFKIGLVPKESLAKVQAKPITEWNSKISITYDEDKYPNVKLLNDTITLKIKNKKEMILKIKVLED